MQGSFEPGATRRNIDHRHVDRAERVHSAASFPRPTPGAARPSCLCRVQVTVQPQIHIEVWLTQAENWNHRFQAEGGVQRRE